MLIDVGGNRPGLVASVAPMHGGRTVALRLPGGPSLIDPGRCDWATAAAREVRADAEWSQDLGQVVWLGPQSRFWADQTAIPGRSIEAQGWPPDPISTNAPYALLENTPATLRLRGPVSPVWQVEITKTWEALPDGAMRFSAEARNVSDMKIQKGLWFNFRAPPLARVLVPMERSSDLCVAGAADLRPWHEGGWICLNPPVVPDGVDVTDAKAYVRPSRGVIRIEAPGGFLQLEFRATPGEAVAEGHAPVEIYRKAHRDSWAILEVEQHAPCIALAPGETMTHEETWRWLSEPKKSRT